MRRNLYKIIVAALLIALFYAVKIYRSPAPFLTSVTSPKQSEGGLKIHFLDVGQGDATLIQTPENKLILVDGGPDGKVLMSRLSPFFLFGECKLEAIILTHPDSDHEAGLLEALKRCQVNQVFANTTNCTLFNCQQFNALNAHVTSIYQNDRYEIGTLGITVLNPPRTQNLNDNDTNSDSVVTELEFGQARVLLTGDATIQNLKNIPEESITILKVPHHGSVNNFDPTLWEEIRPQLAVVSVGKNNYGQPSPKVLGEATILGTKVLRTDEVGDVNVDLGIDGNWVLE
ncbi:MAG: MBL fold metallo-hydrolase [candidate division WWE3 bacterium]|nr:MBL fold metallo-hydrolase [candidate division WWE3 bacterium]